MQIRKDKVMKDLLINVRVESEMKANAVSVCESIGIDLTTAVRLFLFKLIKEKKIPFEIS